MTMNTGHVSDTEEARLPPPGPTGSERTLSSAVARRRTRTYRERVQPLLQRFGALAALVILVAVTGAVSPNFLTAESIRSQLQIFCLTTALIGVGQTLVILTGGIDLSVGALLAVGSCLAAQMVSNTLPILLVFAAPILLTTVIGAVSGAIIAKARIQPIVVTLAMMIAARGLAQLIAGDATINLNDDTFDNLALTQFGALPWFGPIPISVILTAIIYALAAFFLARTIPGRYVFAVGGNERAARLSGVAADRVKILVYALSGLLAGLAGVLYASYNASADPYKDGLLAELATISAVVIGGTSLLGGVGSVWRTLVGGLILVVLFALFVQAGLPTPAQLVAQGLIIAGAVILQGGNQA